MKPAALPDTLLFGGVLSLLAAGLSGELAWLHMRALRDLCGVSAPHCAWCVGAAGFLALGGLLLAAWRRETGRRRALARARI
jgi:hypothetical protein